MRHRGRPVQGHNKGLHSKGWGWEASLGYLPPRLCSEVRRPSAHSGYITLDSTGLNAGASWGCGVVAASHCTDFQTEDAERWDYE